MSPAPPDLNSDLLSARLSVVESRLSVVERRTSDAEARLIVLTEALASAISTVDQLFDFVPIKTNRNSHQSGGDVDNSASLALEAGFPPAGTVKSGEDPGEKPPCS